MYSQNFVVTIKCDGKILRDDKSGSVYLPFGAEYSIFLKNKDSRRALVDIEVDGQNVLNGNKFILNGNESQEVKGFMRDMNVTNRFKFIHKTREIQKHRGDRIDDGLVRVSYQFEKYKEEPIVTINNPTPTWTYYNTGPNTGGNWWASNSSVNLRSASNLDAVYTCCFSDCKSSTPLADEGITVKGSKINQNYVYGNINSLESDIHTIVLHLKGITSLKKEIHKPVTVKTKSKCTICGRGNKPSNNFCYNCGAFLE
jgi:hypothetical protein